MACQQRRIIITINRDDFAKLVGTKDDCGVIGVPDGPAATRTDTKLTALLMQHGPNYFRGRLVPLSKEAGGLAQLFELEGVAGLEGA
jgi:hypothetical protein